MSGSYWPKAVSSALIVWERLYSKAGGEAVPKLRKTYPEGPGLPFAYARITV